MKDPETNLDAEPDQERVTDVRDPKALRRASRRHFITAMVLAVCYLGLFLERQNDHRAQAQQARVLEASLSAGGGAAGKAVPVGKRRYRRYRDKALTWLIPFTVLFLAYAWLRRTEASEAERGVGPGGLPLDYFD